MSLLGVNNLNSLRECTKALPAFKGSYRAPDEGLLQRFMKGLLKSVDRIKEALMKGDKIPSNAS